MLPTRERKATPPLRKKADGGERTAAHLGKHSRFCKSAESQTVLGWEASALGSTAVFAIHLRCYLK